VKIAASQQPAVKINAALKAAIFMTIGLPYTVNTDVIVGGQSWQTTLAV